MWRTLIALLMATASSCVDAQRASITDYESFLGGIPVSAVVVGDFKSVDRNASILVRPPKGMTARELQSVKAFHQALQKNYPASVLALPPYDELSMFQFGYLIRLEFDSSSSNSQSLSPVMARRTTGYKCTENGNTVNCRESSSASEVSGYRETTTRWTEVAVSATVYKVTEAMLDGDEWEKIQVAGVFASFPSSQCKNLSGMYAFFGAVLGSLEMNGEPVDLSSEAGTGKKHLNCG